MPTMFSHRDQLSVGGGFLQKPRPVQASHQLPGSEGMLSEFRSGLWSRSRWISELFEVPESDSTKLLKLESANFQYFAIWLLLL